MLKTVKVRRVVVIVDATLRDQFLERFMKLGAKGYNFVACTGRGAHMVTGGPFSREGLVRIEVLATDEVAEAIMDHIHAVQFQQFGQYALTAFSNVVEVDERDRSLIAD